MRHLLRILEIQHLRNGEVIWEANNLPNTLHLNGEQFILSTVFRSAAGFVIPSFFYLGLDNRSSVAATDNIQSITTEPSGNGYSRQPVSSATGFTIEQFTRDDDDSGIQHWRAKSSVVAFSASGSSWGPVSNVFLTDQNGSAGSLIATAPLPTTRTVAPTDAITLRFALSLFDEDIDD